MPGRDERLKSLAAAWAAKAEEDLAAAAHLLKLGRRCPSGIVCYHAQQCAEKYLKAVLVAQGLDFRKTHDLNALFGLLPHGAAPALDAAQRVTLTAYATEARYPGDQEPVTLREAREALALARRVKRWARAVLRGDAATKARPRLPLGTRESAARYRSRTKRPSASKPKSRR